MLCQAGCCETDNEWWTIIITVIHILGEMRGIVMKCGIPSAIRKTIIYFSNLLLRIEINKYQGKYQGHS